MQEETLNIKSPIKSDVTQIELRMNTIVFLIGPSGCGKTHFTENKLIPELHAQGDVKIHHVASDEIRREILGDQTLSKKDAKMLHASKPAFELLDARVRALTSYPVNADFVVIDSTGLSKDFRDSVKRIADDNNYNIAVVMFDYKGRQPYYDFLSDDEESKAVTSRQIKHMREKTFSEVSKKTFNNITKIKSHDLTQYSVSIINYDRYQECILPSGFDYVTIGDIHGCYDEFVALLEKNDFVVADGKITEAEIEDKDFNPKRIVLVGDLVDKGYNVRGVIELVHNNLDMFFMVKGNHENFVYKFLKNLDGDEDSGIRPKDLPPQEVMDIYFDSIELFKSDEELKQKFYDIVDAMKPFLKADHFIVTHAPCDQKYLGKLGAKSEKSQQTIVYPKSMEFDNKQDYLAAKSKFFGFFRNQASRSLPFHLFGHVSSKGVGMRANKVNLDSGAVSGGHLSSIIINPFGRNISRKTPATNENIVKKELNDFFFTPPPKISMDTLESKERGRVFYASEQGVNFISGTICPADKNIVRDENKNIYLDESELESLSKGVEYFKKNGVKKIIAQPKYMGSRANVYLFKDPSKNYTASRQGYIVKPEKIDLTDAYKPLYELSFIKEAFKDNTELLILDAELLPWSAIGKGLIEKNFVTVDKAVTSEIEFLKENGFEEALNAVVDGPYKDCDFEKISHKTSRKDIIKIVGSNNERTFRAIKDYIREFDDIDSLEVMIKIYSRQIELYGSAGDIHFKPFSILKQVFADGTEKLFFDESNEDIYKAISKDDYLVVDLENPEDIKKLQEFYDKTTIDEEMEGIMLKPLTVYVKGVVPAMKVRNPRYLTIIYGPDYLMSTKLEKLINRKKVYKKLETSVNEWEIGKRLLEIPYNKISKENEHYVQAFGEMVIEERNEREIDPRL
jgi:predicted kinase